MARCRGCRSTARRGRGLNTFARPTGRPTGSTLAHRPVAGFKDQLEYPIGSKLYETTGYVSDVRVSPDGSRVAFMDHQNRFDNRGWVKVVDRDGKVQNAWRRVLGRGRPQLEQRRSQRALLASDLGGGTISAVHRLRDRPIQIRTSSFRTIGSAAAARRSRRSLDSPQRRRTVPNPGDVCGRFRRARNRLARYQSQSDTESRRQGSRVRRREPVGRRQLRDHDGEGRRWRSRAAGRRDGCSIFRPTGLASSPAFTRRRRFRVYPTGAGEPRTLNTGQLENAW